MKYRSWEKDSFLLRKRKQNFFRVKIAMHVGYRTKGPWSVAEARWGHPGMHGWCDFEIGKDKQGEVSSVTHNIWQTDSVTNKDVWGLSLPPSLSPPCAWGIQANWPSRDCLTERVHNDNTGTLIIQLSSIIARGISSPTYWRIFIGGLLRPWSKKLIDSLHQVNSVTSRIKRCSDFFGSRFSILRRF